MTYNYFDRCKLYSLGIGTIALVLGSKILPAPDWDIPVSVIMAVVAYLLAPIVIEQKANIAGICVIAVCTYFAVDGSYSLYWYWQNPEVLESMRDAQWRLSLILFTVLVIWLDFLESMAGSRDRLFLRSGNILFYAFISAVHTLAYLT